jgi:hypothetical protein
MDSMRDTRHSFDLNDEAVLAEARFRMLVGKGHRAVRLSAGQTGAVLKIFDPTADETIFVPQAQVR